MSAAQQQLMANMANGFRIIDFAVCKTIRRLNGKTHFSGGFCRMRGPKVPVGLHSQRSAVGVPQPSA